MDEEIKAALMSARLQIEQLHRQCEVLRYERNYARARADSTVKLLIGIHSLLYPAPIKLEDGRTIVFRPKDPDPHKVLQWLSDRIRALPDELDDGEHNLTRRSDESVPVLEMGYVD